MEFGGNSNHPYLGRAVKIRRNIYLDVPWWLGSDWASALCRLGNVTFKVSRINTEGNQVDDKFTCIRCFFQFIPILAFGSRFSSLYYKSGWFWSSILPFCRITMTMHSFFFSPPNLGFSYSVLLNKGWF